MKKPKLESKYYVLYNIENFKTVSDLTNDLSSYLTEKQCEKIKQQIKLEPNYVVLFEKSCYSDNTEDYTNVWTFYPSSCPSVWEKYTKGKLMYDYTNKLGITIVHFNKKAYTFDEYCKLPNK